MRLFIQKVFFSFFVCLAALPVLGGTGLPKPLRTAVAALGNMKRLDSILLVSTTGLPTEDPSGSPEVLESKGRICSCQVLNLESSNYHHRLVVLLAEKINSGRSADFRVARNRIQMEKKHLKRMFYDKVILVSELQSAGSCKSLYFRLRTADSELQLYEILHAD
jgi:hypothetical protein